MPPLLQAGDEIREGMLFRRIPKRGGQWSAAEKRPTSNNFVPAKSQDHLSMQLASMVTAEEILAAYPDFGLLEIPVAAFLAEGFPVMYLPDGPDVGHVAVLGIKGARGSVLKRLAGQIVRFWSPEDHSLVELNRSPAP